MVKDSIVTKHLSLTPVCDVVYARATTCEKMNEYEIEGEELMARAICHELAHLDGDLYIDHIEGELMDVVAGEE